MFYRKELLGDRVMYSRVCSVTGETYSVICHAADHCAWLDGKLIQDALPYLSAEQREFLISGMTPSEFSELLGPEE